MFALQALANFGPSDSTLKKESKNNYDSIFALANLYPLTVFSSYIHVAKEFYATDRVSYMG